MKKIGQTVHRKLKFLEKIYEFFPHFNHFSLFIDILPTFKDQKRIQYTKLHRKSVLSFNIINRIVKTGHNIVKKWPETTQNQKLWLLRSFCANMTSESIFKFLVIEWLFLFYIPTYGHGRGWWGGVGVQSGGKKTSWYLCQFYPTPKVMKTHYAFLTTLYQIMGMAGGSEGQGGVGGAEWW